jgi:hypothetical protein
MPHRFSSLNDNLIIRRVWSLDGHDSIVCVPDWLFRSLTAQPVKASTHTTRTAPPIRPFASPFAVSAILRWVQNAVIEDILFARGA